MTNISHNKPDSFRNSYYSHKVKTYKECTGHMIMFCYEESKPESSAPM